MCIRDSVNAFKDFTENEPFIRGIVKLLGFKQYAIDYIPDQRFGGSSKYNLNKMKKLAIQGVTSLSIKPLHTAVYLSLIHI